VDPIKSFNALLVYKPQIIGNNILIPSDSYQKYDSICDFFSEEVRLKTKRFDEKYSPADYWKKNYQQIMQTSKKTGIELDEILYKACKGQVNFKITGIVGLLEIASHLINQPLSECTIFDPSAGNGGIIFASMAKSCKHIIANDPNSDLIVPYQSIKSFFGTIKLKKDIDIHLTHQSFSPNYVYPQSAPNPDIIFTSPPFFDVEKYSSEKTQSIEMYPNFQDWLDLFLKPYLTHCIKLLNNNGILLLHYVDFPQAQATSTILKHLEKYFVKTILLKSTKRSYSTPVHIFLKGEKS
jgi:hypothetical protein